MTDSHLLQTFFAITATGVIVVTIASVAVAYHAIKAAQALRSLAEEVRAEIGLFARGRKQAMRVIRFASRIPFIAVREFFTGRK